MSSSNWNKLTTFVSYHNLMLRLTFVSVALRLSNVHFLLAYIVPKNTSLIIKILSIFAYIHTLRNNVDRFSLGIDSFCLILPDLVRLNFLNFNLLYRRFLVKFVSQSFGIVWGILDRNWQFLVYFWITMLLLILWLYKFWFGLIRIQILVWVHFCSRIWILFLICSISEACRVLKEILLWILKLVHLVRIIIVIFPYCSRVFCVVGIKRRRLSWLETYRWWISMALILAVHVSTPLRTLHHVLLYSNLFIVFYLRQTPTCLYWRSNFFLVENWRIWLFKFSWQNWRLKLNLTICFGRRKYWVWWSVMIPRFTPKMVFLFFQLGSLFQAWNDLAAQKFLVRVYCFWLKRRSINRLVLKLLRLHQLGVFLQIRLRITLFFKTILVDWLAQSWLLWPILVVQSNRCFNVPNCLLSSQLIQFFLGILRYCCLVVVR